MADHKIVLNSTNVPLEKLKWVLEPSNGTEGNTFYVTTNDGHFLLLQIVYSTMGFSPNVQIAMRFYGPNGFKKGHSANVAGGNFHLSEDRLSVQCAPMNVKFDPATLSYKVALAAPSPIIVDFTFTPDDGFIQVNDGKVFFHADDPTQGYVDSQFIPKGKVTGTVVADKKVYDLAGSGLFVKAVQFKPQNPARWNFMSFQNDKDAIMLYEWYMTPGWGYTIDHVNYGALVLDHKVVSVTVNNVVKLLKSTHDSWSGFPVPSAIEYNFTGSTKDGQPVTIRMTTPLVHLREKVDLLSELPYLLRTFIQSFVTSPFVYQWLEESEAEITIGEEVRKIKGTLFHETTFLAHRPDEGQ
ncbi:putative cell survival pathways protein [Rhizophlyctis rosea]|nr:putative cell survival pathways protein [Rhizophlyctis rosea]